MCPDMELLSPARRLGSSLSIQSGVVTAKVGGDIRLSLADEDSEGDYGTRSEKAYSLPDCGSMNVMDSESITQVLTSDHHVEQVGLTILMNRNTA